MKFLTRTNARLQGRLYVPHEPDYTVFIAVIAVTSLTSMLSRPIFEAPSVIVSLAVANLAALLLIAFFTLGFLKIKRRKEPGSSYSFAAIILAGFFVGLVKWALTSMFLAQLGFSDIAFDTPYGRALFSSVGGAILFPGLVLFSSIRARYIKQRNFLNSALSDRGIATEDYPELLLNLLSDFRDEVKEGGKTLTSSSLAMQIRVFVTEVLRPLSQDIWKTEFKSLPGFRSSELLRDALFKHVYFWPAVLPIFMISNMYPAIVERGAGLGLIYVALRGAILLAVLSVASKVPTKSSTQANSLYIGVLALIGVLYFGVSQLASPSPPLEEFQSWLLSMVWLVVVTITVGVARALASSGETIDKFYSSWISSRVENSSRQPQLSKYEDRQLAQFLHGTLQSKLSNLATHLEQNPDRGALDGNVKLVDQVISDALREFHERQVKTLDELITRLEADWGGLVEFTFLFSDVSLPESMVDRISQVIYEAVANAYRHGSATRVAINLSEDLLLTVMDDGIGPTKKIPGLGSALFDSIASDWSLIADSTGSTLRLKVRT